LLEYHFPAFPEKRFLAIGKPILGNRIAQIVQEAAAKVGLDRKTYGAHSMRAGFVTAAMLAGISEARVAGHTGHRDMNVLRLYYRNGMVFNGNPVREIGL
jgi:integrase